MTNVDVDGRIERAERYLKEHTGDQLAWYDKKATRYKKLHVWTSLVILTAGAATGIIQVFSQAPLSWVAIATALLAAAVVFAKGMQSLGKYEETWLKYRQAEQSARREYRLYINGAGSYDGDVEEDAAYLKFVEQVEEIFAEEQKLYWHARGLREDEAPEGNAPEE
jgi:hypothetical protein